MKTNTTSAFLPHHIQFALRFAPLVILNGFSSKNNDASSNKKQKDLNDTGVLSKVNRTGYYHKQLMSVMFKHMFSPMNVIKMKLNNCKRVVFFNYDSENDHIQIRHYKIQTATNLKGVSRGIKKIIKQKRAKFDNKKASEQRNGMDADKYPDLSKYKDITDYVEQNKEEYCSESEVEDDEATKVIIDKIKSGNSKKSGAHFVRLKEIGPRITMELVKIEELVNDGKVLYHRYVNKTEAEIRELQQRKDQERQLKEERRVKQQLNIKKKEQAKKEKQNQRLENRKQREVEKLLKSFELDEDDKDDDEKGEKKQKRRRKKRVNENEQSQDGPSQKKRKFDGKKNE